MLKQFTAILFLAAFIGQTFNKPFIVVDYYTNNAEYLKACINKARPKMNCNGKCQMMKKIQEEEKKELENPVVRPEFKTEVFSSHNFTYEITTPSFLIETFFNSFYKVAALCKNSNAVFHPPQV